jgi:hypothetical protein
MKSGRGVCNVNTFCGIALTYLVSKVLCKILENRLSGMAKEQGLIEEEQGGFRKGRSCRDQYTFTGVDRPSRDVETE